MGVSSTGTSYFIQQRTALFARVALICSLAGLLIHLLTDTLATGPARAGAVYGCFVVANLAMLGFWLFVRKKPRSLPLVRRCEIVAV
jgi:hypothetical protein